MVKIRDPLLDARRSVIHLAPLLPLSPLQSMEAQEVSILCLRNVFFSFIAPYSA